MKIVFMGTPEFAVPSLRALVENNYNVVGVITQPDRPKGRGGKMQKSPVKLYAEEKGLNVFQPEKLKNDVATLKNLSPDICVTAAFGQILTQEILDIPKYTVNVHASLLPRHRGAAPIQWAILSGDSHTGVTTMLTDKGIDTGDILLQESCEILPSDNAETLSMKLAEMGAELLIKTLEQIEKITPQKQDNSLSTYDPMIEKQLGCVDFTEDAEYIERLSRAMHPWPRAFFISDSGGTYKLSDMKLLPKSGKEPGTVIKADKDNGIVIATNTKDIALLRIAAPNKKEMDTKAYLLGNEVKTGINYKQAFK